MPYMVLLPPCKPSKNYFWFKFLKFCGKNDTELKNYQQTVSF